MSDVHKVDSLISEAGSDLLALLLEFEDKREEALYLSSRNIVSVRTLNKRLSFEVEDGYEAGHGWC